MTQAIDPTEELDDLERSLDSMAALRERVGPELGERVTAVSGWSCAQHLFHASLSCDLALRTALALHSWRSQFIVHAGEPNALAREVFEQGGYPRGESEAPRMVQPPDEPDEDLLNGEMLRSRESLEAARALLAEISTATGRIPHPLLGALDALEWLRFARLHARHHLAILEDVERALKS